ncbi:hypothetical protein P7K49_015241 [Saguinus oedipus]|uniref:Uncharacterized protein n=1 Tax=Saguinus oedipus TaxID=9490 RepID=A0ABQ9VBH1_SAGOE|nr:hypothetical protein P7K49_015241 [Saguinus oedipus]
MLLVGLPGLALDGPQSGTWGTAPGCLVSKDLLSCPVKQSGIGLSRLLCPRGSGACVCHSTLQFPRRAEDPQVEVATSPRTEVCVDVPVPSNSALATLSTPPRTGTVDPDTRHHRDPLGCGGIQPPPKGHRVSHCRTHHGPLSCRSQNPDPAMRAPPPMLLAEQTLAGEADLGSRPPEASMAGDFRRLLAPRSPPPPPAATVLFSASLA